MADYNKMLMDVLTDISKNSNEKNGAKKFLMGLKSAMSVASALNVPFAGTANMLIGLADAGMAGLDGKADAVDLDKLFVSRATDSLKSKGVSEDAINKILNDKK